MGANANDDDEDRNDGPGLIDLDFGQFGSGSLSDPLRHAVGLRTAQDKHKMRMWDSFPALFQNTIFHGEQDPEIKSLRRDGSLAERLARAARLKEEGNAALKAASGAPSGQGALAVRPDVEEAARQREELGVRAKDLEAAIVEKEKELRELRRQLKHVQTELVSQDGLAGASNPNERDAGCAALDTEALEKAISCYEKAAGLLRYVECVRSDWRNEDGSYKGIEDEHLRVDTAALDGDGHEAESSRELVTSCYLNIALASQRLRNFDQMRRACDEVLTHVNPNSVKALYRRAQARIAPASALDADRGAAIKDLVKAAQLAPQDKEVRALLTRLRSERQAKEASERNAFAGMFERGEVVTNDPRTEGVKLDPKELDLRDPRVQALLDVRPGPSHYENLQS